MDSLGMPPEEFSPEDLATVKMGMEQIVQLCGYSPDNPFTGLDTSGFYALLITLHYKLARQSIKNDDATSILDEMRMIHVIDGREIVLYNKVLKSDASESEMLFNPVNSEEEYLFDMPLYEPYDCFLLPFWEFARRIESLNRYWGVQKDYMINKLAKIKPPTQEDVDNLVPANEVIECDLGMLTDLYEETEGADKEYFPEYIRGSILAMAFSLVETLLDDIARDVVTESEVDVASDERPYINNYVLKLIRNIDIDIKKESDDIKGLRIKCLKMLDKTLPDYVMNTLETLSIELRDDNFLLDNDYVDNALRILCDIVKAIEGPCAEFVSMREKK
jgi:hypothetical protein